METESDEGVIQRYVKATDHLTQEDAGRLIGLSQRAFSDWRGEKRPKSLSPDRRQKVLAVLAGAKDGRVDPGPAGERTGDYSPGRIFDILERGQVLGREITEVARILAQAELERAVAARIAAEGARDLWWGVSSPETVARAGVVGSAAVQGLEGVAPQQAEPEKPSKQRIDPPERGKGKADESQDRT